MVEAVRTRDSAGRFRKGFTGNPQGRLPRQTETEYLEVTMREVPPEKWAEIVALAVDDALGDNVHSRARAREWLAKHLIGDPATVHQFLYREERSFEIKVIFGDNGRALPEPAMEPVIDVEPVVLEHADRD